MPPGEAGCPLCDLLDEARRIASREQHVSDWIALGRQVVALVDELAEVHSHDWAGDG